MTFLTALSLAFVTALLAPPRPALATQTGQAMQDENASAPARPSEPDVNTPLGRAIAAASPGIPGVSGIHPLVSALDAFAARVVLMRAAVRTLDLQYYIWHDDITGTLMLEEVMHAARRGVHVRLLLDDNGIAGLDPALAVLDAHPLIEVRLFNPYPIRGFKALGYLTDFRRLNHRMHNKSLTADGLATIVGGRNIGDAYFGADANVEFSDLDVLAAGDAAREVVSSFEAYWASEAARPAGPLLGAPAPQAHVDLQAQFDAVRASPEVVRYRQAVVEASLIQQIESGRLALDWVPAKLLADPPEKAQGDLPDSKLLATSMGRAFGPAHRTLDVVSAYFVPGKLGTEAFAKQAGAGVRVRIVTNSLAATDVAAVHAGYARRRVPLLEAGVKLYELKPDAGSSSDRGASSGAGATVGTTAGSKSGKEDDKQADSGFGWSNLAGGSAASLHGKTFAIDGERMFVGSFNFDPRSVRLNTEMGLLIASPSLASALSDGLDARLADIAYEVKIHADGGLVWIERTPAGEVQHRQEPRTGLLLRLGVGLLSWLPIEWLL